MTSKLELLPPDAAGRLRELPRQLDGLAGLEAVWLFGSFARGEATAVSDIDLAFLHAESLTEGQTELLERRLYGLVASTLHSDEFSLVNLRTAPACLAWRVLTEGKPLVAAGHRSVGRFAERVYRLAPELYRLRRRGNAEFLRGELMNEPQVDADRIIDFLRLLRADLKDLQQKATGARDPYLQDSDKQAVVERRLQRATESCLNIGNHIVARRNLGTPEDYAAVFRILGEGQVLETSLADGMGDMARLRNLLVHLYCRVDAGRLFDSLPDRLRTLDAFATRIAQWLNQQ